MLQRSFPVASALSTLLLIALLQADPARAADLFKLSDFKFETKLNTWLSEGETRWSHNASAASALLGNPTSELQYQDVGTNVVEIGGQVTLLDRFFLRAEYGFADIGGGRLTDDDYLSAAGATAYQTATPGAQRVSRTFSDINGNDMWYVNLDAGYKFVRFPESKGSLGVFLGYQYWRESHTATGVTQAECTSSLFCSPAGTVSNAGRVVISNTAAWSSFRMGLEGDYRVFSRVELGGKVAFIPYTSLSNRDIHYLRTDLAQNPSFQMTGTGIGVNAEGTVSYMILNELFFDVGYRFWWLNITDGQLQSFSRTGGGSTFPLVEFMSMRQGMTLGLRYTF